MHTVVERDLVFSLALSPERRIPVPARLTYRTEDPHAVHFTFHTESQSPVSWSFARQLLVEGIYRPAGYGDVRIWPSKAGERSLLHVSLTSPDGVTLLEAPIDLVSAWLERTLRIVPPGSEDEHPTDEHPTTEQG
ncbi:MULTISPECIES: SsgA family sporulation/cell division regulator [unclassified Streptomyces]|uniref:SsgA family sporulation/cell division regulator n=1 Tax=unclassified Streptomyces TaxID=2593676 RepID=UPI003FD14E06